MEIYDFINNFSLIVPFFALIIILFFVLIITLHIINYRIVNKKEMCLKFPIVKATVNDIDRGLATVMYTIHDRTFTKQLKAKRNYNIGDQINIHTVGKNKVISSDNKVVESNGKSLRKFKLLMFIEVSLLMKAFIILVVYLVYGLDALIYFKSSFIVPFLSGDIILLLFISTVSVPALFRNDNTYSVLVTSKTGNKVTCSLEYNNAIEDRDLLASNPVCVGDYIYANLKDDKLVAVNPRNILYLFRTIILCWISYNGLFWWTIISLITLLVAVSRSNY